ncbi:hypothetical protein [denwin virus]|uniref:Uncharacterized protein n=1 Tax=denwin virus TaxID=2940993 RepID=A0AAE9HR71_9MONO|nr:hypothetical protein [denwin virus]
MSFDVYEVPPSEARSYTSNTSRRTRYIRKDYKCTAIIILLIILAITITSSYFVIWLVSNSNKTGYNTEIDQRNYHTQNRIQPITTIRHNPPNKYPFRPGIPGRNDCQSRTVPNYP